MRIAIPVWNDQVSPVFDCAQRLLVVDIEGGSILKKDEQQFSDCSLLQRVDRLSQLEVDELLCGAISRHLYDMLGIVDIKVIPFLTGNIEDIITTYLTGQEFDSEHQMPGGFGKGQCKRRRRRCSWRENQKDSMA